MKNYLFTSQRLGFRNWETADIDPLIELNQDEEVMEFFPDIVSEKQSRDFVDKMQKQFAQNGFCYFAVDRLDKQKFIGFIGLSRQEYKAAFTPCIDIGWRLKKEEWNKGFATEGAKACLDYAFNTLGIEKINSVAPEVNVKSEMVMKKIGMKRVMTFEHPLLTTCERLKNCVLYEKNKESLVPA